jgi:hypothetical protein
VSFSGQWGIEHSRRNAYWCALTASRHDLGADIHWHLLPSANCPLPTDVAALNHPPKFGLEMFRLFRRSRINLNASIDISQHPAPNMRFLEITGAGGFQLVEHASYVSQFLEPGREVETFRDAGEIKEKIRHYLANPEERRAIARRGQERLIREHGHRHRSQEFASLVMNHLKQTRDVTVWIPQPLHTWQPPVPVKTGSKLDAEKIKARVRKLELRLESRENDLQAIRGSFCWRLLRPLFGLERSIRKLFSGRRSR